MVARLEPDAARAHHHRLALVLEASGQADPEVLGLHFLGADLPERAAEFFVQAADKAAEMLAFERTATLYRRALEHQPRRSSQERILRARLGDALANAGRGPDAARAYLEAVAHATVAEALELHAPRGHAVLDQRAYRRGARNPPDRAGDGGHDAAEYPAPVPGIAFVAADTVAAARPGFPRARSQ